MVKVCVQGCEQVTDRTIPVTENVEKLLLLEHFAVNEDFTVQVRDHDGQSGGRVLQHIFSPQSTDESRLPVHAVYCELDVINGFDGGIPDLIEIVFVEECGFLMYGLLDAGSGCHQQK